jgi:hypothetical protein
MVHQQFNGWIDDFFSGYGINQGLRIVPVHRCQGLLRVFSIDDVDPLMKFEFRCRDNVSHGASCFARFPDMDIRLNERPVTRNIRISRVE